MHQRWAALLHLERDGSKTAAAVSVAAIVRDDDWGQALTEAANRDAVRLAGGASAPSRQPGGDPVDAATGTLATIAASEGPAFAAVARNWAWSDAMLMSALENGSGPPGNLNNLYDVQAACRDRFLNTPARTLDGVLAKSLVLATYIQTEDDPLAACFAALQEATRNTPEACFAFSVMRDLGAMLAERGITVEALAAQPAGDVGLDRDEMARLTAEWLRTRSIDGRDRDTLAAMTPCAIGEPDALGVFQANARDHLAVLHRIAALRSTAPDILALKAAAVLAGCRDAVRIDEEIARDEGADLNSGDLSVALSLARDVAALFPNRVAPLLAVANAAADLPTIDRSAMSATPARSAA